LPGAADCDAYGKFLIRTVSLIGGQSLPPSHPLLNSALYAEKIKVIDLAVFVNVNVN
jgi:hypothetical protein